MSLIEIHSSKTHWISTLNTDNKIHDPIMRFMTCLTRVATHKGLEKCLGLDSSLACLLLLNFWPHIQLILRVLTVLITIAVLLFTSLASQTHNPIADHFEYMCPMRYTENYLSLVHGDYAVAFKSYHTTTKLCMYSLFMR